VRLKQWHSILQCKRLGVADFADKAELAERLQAFIRERNEVAHPFAWSTKSAAEVMAKCEPEPPARPDAFRLAAFFCRFINAATYLGRRRKMARRVGRVSPWHVWNMPHYLYGSLF
jgi:hypothetical protein